MKSLRYLTWMIVAAACGSAYAGPITIADFSGNETVTTFDALGLPFQNATPVVFDGNTYTTDDGRFRYTQPNTFEADCAGECIGNNTDRGYIDVVLGGPFTRVGARVGGATTTYAGYVEFFDASDVLLGTINFGGQAGMVFAGWESLGGIGRFRVTDTAGNGRITHMDDFRFEAVPEPATLALLGAGLLGLGFSRRRRS